MAKEINLELPNVDDLFKFSTNKGKAETVVMIPIEKISDFPNHPFKVRDDEKMIETVASIKKHGVIFPAIVSNTPSIFNLEFICTLVLSIVCMSCVIPFNGRY